MSPKKLRDRPTKKANFSMTRDQLRQATRIQKFSNKQKLRDALKKLNPVVDCLSDTPDFEIENLIKKVKSTSVKRSDEDLRQFLRRYCKKIADYKYRNDQPIDKWFDITDAITPRKTDLEQQISTALMVATQEPIPDVSSTFSSSQKENVSSSNSSEQPKFPEPDYNSIYTYLASSIAGKSLPTLSPVESLVIEDCIQSLAEQIKSLNDGDLRLNLRKVYLYLHQLDGHEPEDDEGEIEKQLDLANVFNPMGVNPNLIMPVPPK